jgi:predicted TIM-barrel fold metal-dependent hydrolase
MFVDAHAYITQGLHGSTGAGRTRSLPYGCAQHGDQVVRILPPLSAERTALEPETMLRLMDWAGIDKMVLMQGPFYGDQNTFLYQTTENGPTDSWQPRISIPMTKRRVTRFAASPRSMVSAFSNSK